MTNAQCSMIGCEFGCEFGLPTADGVHPPNPSRPRQTLSTKGQMNHQTHSQSPRKRPRPQSSIRNPSSAPAPVVPNSGARDRFVGIDNNNNNNININNSHQQNDRNGERSRENHHHRRELLSWVEELELTSEFGGITESLRNISLKNEKHKHKEEKKDEREHQKGDALQEKAIALAKEGRNMFLTGKAGTGKSCSARKIELTVPMGIAAINIGGKTIHSWGGFRLGEYHKDSNRMTREQTRRLIQTTDTLLIDEISMVDGRFFDVLECMVTIIRYYDEVKDRLKNIQKTMGGEKDSIMSPHLLDMRWKKSGDGLGDVPPWGVSS
jgi:hypothetical protein